VVNDCEENGRDDGPDVSGAQPRAARVVAVLYPDLGVCVMAEESAPELALLPGEPAGLGGTDPGFDPWLGRTFHDVDDDYTGRWAALARALWIAGVEPSYAWAGAEVGYLVTEANRNLFADVQVARYRQALARQLRSSGDGDIGEIVDAVPEVLRRTLGDLLAAPGPRVARAGIDRCFDQAVRVGAELDDLSVIAAFVFDTLYAWLAAAGERGADPDRALAWVRDSLGEQAGADAHLVVAAMWGRFGDSERRAVGRRLSDRHGPAALHLVAGAVAMQAAGDVSWLDGADPSYY
jgi:hypothetical protein